ncbi:MAG TPA: type II CAAX endopeptidase family protein [Granulicella sp.]
MYEDSSSSDRNHILFGREGLRAGWGLLIFVLIFSLLVSGGHALAAHLHRHAAPAGSEETPWALYTTEGLSLVIIALTTWIMSRIEGRSVGDYGFGGSHAWSRFFAGLGWGVTFLTLLVLALRMSGLLVFSDLLLHDLSSLRYGAIWLIGFLLVGLVEESLLRGYLQLTLARGLAALYEPIAPRRSRALGFWTAALLLSFLFGLSHQSNHGESPLGVAAAGLAGLVFCLSLWRTGSLWWAIGFHASWDWAQSFLYGVADSGIMVSHRLLATHPAGTPLMSGGATGPEGSLYILPTLALVAAVIVLTLPRTAAETEAGSAKLTEASLQ